jgi:hypothetical protein
MPEAVAAAKPASKHEQNRTAIVEKFMIRSPRHPAGFRLTFIPKPENRRRRTAVFRVF